MSKLNSDLNLIGQTYYAANTLDVPGNTHKKLTSIDLPPGTYMGTAWVRDRSLDAFVTTLCVDNNNSDSTTEDSIADIYGTGWRGFTYPVYLVVSEPKTYYFKVKHTGQQHTVDIRVKLSRIR